MTFATGVAKQVVIAQETTEGVSPVTGGKQLRRVSSDLAMNVDAYESQEILVSQQIQDARHGTHRPQGTFSGQISPGSFDDFWQGILRNTWTTGVSLDTITLALSTTAGTLTLSGGGLNAAGFLKNDVVVITGATSPNAAINNVPLRIKALSDTVITTLDLPSGLSAGNLTGVTLAVMGSKLWIPATSQQLLSYSIEHFFSDIGESELFLGCRMGQTSIALPASGLTTFSTQIMAIDMMTATERQLTSPAAVTTSSALAAVDGTINYNGVDQAIITGMSIQLNGALGADPVVGSDVVPHIFQGRFRVSGNLTALFENETIYNDFIEENEVSISLMLTVAGDFMRFTMPRVKLMSLAKSDGDMSLIQTFGFTALENVADTESDLTTFVMQDSTVAGG
jgi:hypothetical protein